MRVVLSRFAYGADSTLGRLLVPGTTPCFTLEDERRLVKVWGETCIPPGEYRITLRKEGGFHARYAKRFPGVHQGMLWIRDVPDFEYILIHCGNDDDDTAGCPLVGEGATMTPDAEFTIQASVAAYLRVYPVIVDALLEGEEVWLEVRDEPCQ